MAKKKFRKKSKKEMTVPLWFMDGFTGLLALMIYNFLLYIIEITNIKGYLFSIADAMGYFGLNTYLDFGFNSGQMAIGVILMFISAFMLGILISAIVRKKNKKLV